MKIIYDWNFEIITKNKNKNASHWHKPTQTLLVLNIRDPSCLKLKIPPLSLDVRNLE